jgi:hypothetical protein
MTPESKAAFDAAIREGRLSDDVDLIGEHADNYAGNYMYMGQKNGRDLFKNINTREYLNDNN